MKLEYNAYFNVNYWYLESRDNGKPLYDRENTTEKNPNAPETSHSSIKMPINKPKGPPLEVYITVDMPKDGVKKDMTDYYKKKATAKKKKAEATSFAPRKRSKNAPYNGDYALFPPVTEFFPGEFWEEDDIHIASSKK